jgi:4-hydroxythreonine-4-phosphate dehydrogenase
LRNSLPFIAVTSGEPGGIGPEIVAKLFGRYRPEHSIALVVGAPDLFLRWRRRFRFTPPVVNSIDEAREAARHSRGRTRACPALLLMDTGVDAEYPIGQDSAGGGLHAGTSIRWSCELARIRAVAAIVTPPASKKSLNLAHFDFPGHTEMLAHYLNAPDCQMMMARRDLRVIPFTRHVPLARVAGYLTADRLTTCIRVTHDALRSTFRIARPRIAVAGLNPHAGEDGVIGTEDRDVIRPVIERLRSEGIDVSGPHPADAMFQSAPAAAKAPERPVGRTRVAHGGQPARSTPRASRRARYYDAYITMYHDQGLIPFKMLARRRGVNVTIGLPTPRTSVDHGTAYDIAGRGIAETDSLLEAYKLAEAFVVSGVPKRARKTQ